jgi:uncharacterized cupin superfamily protein
VPPEGVTSSRLDFGSGERFSSLSLSDALGLRSFGLRLHTLAPRQRNRIHLHRDQEEVYLVLEGELTIGFEGGEELTVRRHELVRVPPEHRRQLMNRGDAPVQLLAIGAAGTHESADGEAFPDWSTRDGRPPLEIPYPEDLPT